jgi:hypothetical protein
MQLSGPVLEDDVHMTIVELLVLAETLGNGICRLLVLIGRDLRARGCLKAFWFLPRQGKRYPQPHRRS